jgi:hypothetical protein
MYMVYDSLTLFKSQGKISLNNTSCIYKNFFYCHENTQHSTLFFGNRMLPSSGETTNPKTIGTILFWVFLWQRNKFL